MLFVLAANAAKQDGGRGRLAYKPLNGDWLSVLSGEQGRRPLPKMRFTSRLFLPGCLQIDSNENYSHIIDAIASLGPAWIDRALQRFVLSGPSQLPCSTSVV